MSNIAKRVNDFLSDLDTYVWEPLERKFPVLYRIDDRDWKSWIAHGAITVLFGGFLSVLPWVTWTGGAWFIAFLYLVREFSAREVLGWHYKPLDGIGDVLGPVVGATLVTLAAQ